MRKVLSWGVGCVAFAVLAIPGTAVGSEATEPREDTEPVVFVYGYNGKATDWGTAEGVFRDVGYAADRLFTFDYDWTRSNERAAADLSAFVDAVLGETGASKVDIVSHSMGALVSGWYAKKLGGAEKIDDWISLAGANHGTTAAVLCTVHVSCREMVPGSEFVRRLHADGEAPPPVAWSTWYSPADGVIIPYDSAALAGADNHEEPVVLHTGFLSNTRILSEVARTTSAEDASDSHTAEVLRTAE